MVLVTIEVPQLQVWRGGRCPCCAGFAGFSGAGGHRRDPTFAVRERSWVFGAARDVQLLTCPVVCNFLGRRQTAEVRSCSSSCSW